MAIACIGTKFPKLVTREWTLSTIAVLVSFLITLNLGCVRQPPAQLVDGRSKSAVEIVDQMSPVAIMPVKPSSVTSITPNAPPSMSSVPFGQVEATSNRRGNLNAHATTEVVVAEKLENVRATAFSLGRKVGEAEAAAKHFERGLAIGKEQGRREGKADSVEANRLATELAVKEAVSHAEQITRLKTAEDIRQTERLREMTDSDLPAYFLGTALVSLLFFMLARMDRWRARNADAHAAQYRHFIYQIFDVVGNLNRRGEGDGDGSMYRHLPPPLPDDDRFRFGGGQ